MYVTENSVSHVLRLKEETNIFFLFVVEGMAVNKAPETFQRALKVTMVGDGHVGKTCILIVLTTGAFPTDYVPTVFDTMSYMLEVDQKKISLQLWDTAGQEDYERLRPLSYPHTDIFLLCFSVNNRASFDNIESKWVSELRLHCPHTPIMIVATKSDLKDGSSVKTSEGQALAERISAFGYIECSAKKEDTVLNLFQESVRLLQRPRPKKGKICSCSIL